MMTTTIKDTEASTDISQVFYVTEDTNSPYQGLIKLPSAEFAALTPEDLGALKLAQFRDWKERTVALQAQAAIDALLPPTQITKVELVNAIVTLGWFDEVTAFVNKIVDQKQRLFWETLADVPREGPMLNDFAAQMWPKDSQARLDLIFRTVKGL